jgi:dihydrofolate synthase / folylpolyglutamate synthase
VSYREILQLIYARGRFGMRPGLERILPILERLGNPQDRVPVVHVVGTNGKGSTSAFLASILSAAGYRVGLFTSPHLISFTERIRIDGEEITEEEVSDLARRVLAVAPPEATFFEIVTSIGFLHFAQAGCDIAVVEAGMGGTHDATSVADGILSVVTPVGLDHAAYLGGSVAEIAAEKAGIVKPGRPVIVSAQPEEALAVIRERCRSIGSAPLSFGADFGAEWREGCLDYRGVSLSLDGFKPGIPGRYQRENAASALAAAEALGQLGFTLPPEALRHGAESASWAGRMEIFPGPPRVLLDGAHNPAGALALGESLSEIPRKRLLLVFGAMGDKDVRGMLEPLLNLCSRVYAVTPAVTSSLLAADIAAFCAGKGIPVTEAGTIAEGLPAAMTEGGPEDLVVVAGSLYLVGEARALLLERRFEPCRG